MYQTWLENSIGIWIQIQYVVHRKTMSKFGAYEHSI